MKKIPASLPYDDLLDEQLRDPRIASAYLNEAVRDNDLAQIRTALYNIARAYGIEKVAKKMQVHPKSLSRMFSEHGSPRLENYLRLLDAVGMVTQAKPREAVAA